MSETFNSNDKYFHTQMFRRKFHLSFALSLQYQLIFQMHITLQSPVACHCCSYALSDSSDFFHNPCTDHEHDQVCIDCKNLDDTLQLILEKTTARNWDNQDAFLFKVIILELIFFHKIQPFCQIFVKFIQESSTP